MRTAVLGLVAGAIPALAGEHETNTWAHNPWGGNPSMRVYPSIVATVTMPYTFTTTVCPCSEAPAHSASEVSPVSSSVHPIGPGKSTVTDHTTIYTTLCPVTETRTRGTTTMETTYTTTSTVTKSYKTTVTGPISHSKASPTESKVTPTVQSSYHVTGEHSYTTYTTKCTETINGTTSVGVHTHSKPIQYTTSTPATYGSSVSSHSSHKRSISSTSTGSLNSTITSSSKLSTSTFYPNSTISSSQISSSTAHSNGTTSSSTKLTSSSTSSASTCTTPTPTGKCTPCEGQSGTPDNHCGLDINTNYYQETPNTCREVEYDFEITENLNFAPDGVPRLGMLVNGQMPGPLVEANWGDWIVIHVTNKLPENGTSLHFHGFRQYYTNEMDGVPSITQCPLAPGEKMTYRFRASNYGTSWYHSHFAIQTYEGVFGPVIIHGPNSGGSYDAEQMIVLQDWNHQTVDSIYDATSAFPTGGAPTLDTGLINGMNVWNTGKNSTNSTQVGKRFEMEVVKGQTYLLRVVNTAIQSTFKFHLDGHKFKVISTDFVDIEPYETDILNINIGQRYNLLVTFDQDVGNYWMRSDNQNSCSKLVNSRDIRGIVRYKGSSSGLPTSTAAKYTDECIDEPYDKLVPIVPLDAGAQDQTITENIVIGSNNGSDVGPNGEHPNLYKWQLGDPAAHSAPISFHSRWEDPTLYHINNNGTVPDYSGQLAIEVPKLGEWVYVIVESPIPLPHPIHLHGHDFLILSQGVGAYNSSTVLNTKNPPRRDVANMPWDGRGQGGYLVLAFKADNPGAWLMHCHIGWHVAQGFALQIIENLDGIKPTLNNTCQMNDTCAAWQKYANANQIEASPYESGV